MSQRITAFIESGFSPSEELGKPFVWKYTEIFPPRKEAKIGDAMFWNTEQEAIEFAYEECLGCFIVVNMLSYFILIENV